MSLVRSIAKNTLIQIAGKGVSTLLGLLAVSILTRAMGAEKFGWYSTAIGFLQFVAVLTDFGFTVVTAKMLSEPNFDKRKLLNNLFTWRLITALASQSLAVGAIWLFPYSSTIKIATLILALSYIPNILNQVFTGYYQTKLRVDIQMAGEVLGRMALVVGFWLAVKGNLDFFPMMWVVAIAAWIYTIYIWRKSGGVAPRIDKEETKAIFQKMWPVAIGVIFNAFYLQGDRLILPLYANAVEVGLYSAAYRVLDILSQVAFMTMGIMLPLLTFSWSRGLYDEFKKHYQLSFDLMLIVLAPMVVGVIALAAPIMGLIFGSEFTAGGPILALLSVAVFGICFGSTFSQMALAINKQKQATLIFGADAVLSVIAYFIFIPRFGMLGAAYVTIFSELFAGLGFFLLCAYHTRLWPKITTALKVALASSIMGILLYYLQAINIVILILLGVLIYASLVILFRIVSIQTLKEVLYAKTDQNTKVVV